MTLEEFMLSAESDSPATGLPPELEALRIDARGDWDAAHQLVQSLDMANAAWVHAYLHRREGDLGNASYWYQRAGRPVSNVGLDQEWREIVATLLEEDNYK